MLLQIFRGLNVVILSFVTLLSERIDGDANFIVKPIAWFLGIILNFIFSGVYALTQGNSLGWAIILFTLVARTLMLPLGFKQQKSTFAMRKLQPEMDAIRKKYEGRKDADSQRAMSAETNELYSRHKVNPFAGCLPMLITLPIFFALTYLLRNSFQYVHIIGELYDKLATAIMEPLNGTYNGLRPVMDIFSEIVKPKLGTLQLDTEKIIDLTKMLSSLNSHEWTRILNEIQSVAPANANEISALLQSKAQIETFFGVNLVDNAGWMWPGVLVPVLSGVTTFLSTWIINKQSSMGGGSSAKTQQTVMLVVMPAMMLWMTAGFSAGVGIYWAVSNVYQTVQQVLLGRYYERRFAMAESERASLDDPKPIITIDKSKHSKKGAK